MNRDELLAAMQRFLTAVKSLLSAFLTQRQASDSITRLHEQLAYLTEAESADASHPIHTLDSRYMLMLNELIVISQVLLSPLCLQCFDTVGWVAGRASGL